MVKTSNNPILNLMLDELKKAPRIYKPSPFWQHLNEKHLDSLQGKGLENFKRSVNKKYFSWGSLAIIYHQLDPVFGEILQGNFQPFISFFKAPTAPRYPTPLTITGIIQSIYICYLYDFVSRVDNLKLLTKIKEPSLGNPEVVYYRNSIVSQDLCNSVYEFYSIINSLDDAKGLRILELGAGYGRLGYVFLKALKGVSICIVDLPPALYIAQDYLSKLFPKTKVFSFQHFTSYKEISHRFESSRIKFLMPHQLPLIPKKSFDIVINISSLHEVSKVQIKKYFNHIDRLSRGFFYSKQWKKSRTKDNDFIKETEYPVPRNWKTVYHHQHPIQNMFFEAFYKIN